MSTDRFGISDRYADSYADLDPDAEPAGTLRVGGFATGIRVSLLPILADLARRHPGVEVVISEYEPVEAFTLLTDDDLDLALTYDYNLAPTAPGPLLETVPLWSIPWGLGVPSDEPNRSADVSSYADRTWIVNSRNTADEDRHFGSGQTHQRSPVDQRPQDRREHAELRLRCI